MEEDLVLKTCAWYGAGGDGGVGGGCGDENADCGDYVNGMFGSWMLVWY